MLLGFWDKGRWRRILLQHWYCCSRHRCLYTLYMSEHGSSQSFKAGYRRSRLEPIDPAMLSGPTASPVRTSSPRSTGGSRTPAHEGTEASDPQKQDTSTLTKVMKFMFILHNVLFLVCSIVAVIIASLLFYIFQSTGQSAKDICDGTAMCKALPCDQASPLFTYIPLVCSLDD
jgi:hypothetical protein